MLGDGDMFLEDGLILVGDRPIFTGEAHTRVDATLAEVRDWTTLIEEVSLSVDNPQI